MQFYIVIVIYNQYCRKCKCFSLIDSDMSVFIVDNSTREDIVQENKNFCLKHRIQFIDMKGNKGIPKAYNVAISAIGFALDTWIILCDQDTEISSGFINQYRKAISDNPDKQIFCPVVKDSKGIMSPSRIKGKKYKHSKSTDFNTDIEKYSFINSCMCINAAVFQGIRYDENLFLDFADHDFVNTVRSKYAENVFFVINDFQVFQNFSGVTKNSMESDFARFKIYVADAHWYYEKLYRSRSVAFFILFVRAVKLSFVHKRMCFLKHYLNWVSNPNRK